MKEVLSTRASLPHLVALQSDAGAFCGGVAGLLLGVGAEDGQVAHALKLALEPHEQQVREGRVGE